MSAAIASLFSDQARDFHALSARAAPFHDQFLQALNGGAGGNAGIGTPPGDFGVGGAGGLIGQRGNDGLA